MSSGFRGSLGARRIGASLLAVFVVGHLVAITYWRFENFGSQRPAPVLAALWLLGVLALVLLFRAWRAR
jgi:hypothetical protein